MWIGSTVATAVSMALLAQAMHEIGAALSGTRFPSNWRSFWLVLEAALVAAVVVRLALPLIPHFDRMTPRNL